MPAALRRSAAPPDQPSAATSPYDLPDRVPVAPLALTDEERAVLTLLRRHTYDEVRAETGWSKGRIYALALRAGARKQEQRIRERAAARRQRQQEFLASILEQTVTADVLDFLDGLPSDSVQLFCTSVPYNLGKKYGDCPGADAMRAVNFHGWLMMVLSEMSRIVKPGGTVFLQVGMTRDETDALLPLDVLLFPDLKRAGLTFQNRVIWTQPHGLTPAGRLAGRYETALVFSKGPSPVFNPTAARTPQKQPGKRAFKGPRRGQLSGHPFGAHPTDVWTDLLSVRANHPDRQAQRASRPVPGGPRDAGDPPLLDARRSRL